ncbi:MAG: Uma2 family endonuclease [Symploca sp. SIO2D2]|nr:Uma2 family endonuclease [Symploca sp. SIO2D2]
MVQTPTRTETETLSIDLPITLALYVTQEQFALAEANRYLRLERTAQGELVVNPPTGWETGKRNLSISGELYLWWRNAGEPGEAFDSSTGFILPNGATRSPDASWVKIERWNALTQEQRKKFLPLCPDFALEIVSETDDVEETRTKMREYLDNGLRLGWLINPKLKQVEIYRPNREVEVLQSPATLSGEEVLPGFVLDLQPIFA